MSAWCLTTRFHCGPEPKFGKINVQNNMMAPIVGTSLYQMINNKYNNDLHEFRILLHKRYNFGEYMVLVTHRWVR